MKKIISMGISAAVLAVSAVAASAALVVDTADVPVAGEQVVVTVVTTEDVEAFDAVITAEGLELVDFEKAETGNIEWNGETGGLSGASTDGWAADTVLLTLTYTVTAETGEEVSVSIEGEDIEVGDPITLTVEESAGGDVSDPGTDDPGTDDPGTDDPGTDDPGTDIPGTGVALAVVPAVLAGAAVVVAKKRK